MAARIASRARFSSGSAISDSESFSAVAKLRSDCPLQCG
jgi:hypothetical protein